MLKLKLLVCKSTAALYKGADSNPTQNNVHIYFKYFGFQKKKLRNASLCSLTQQLLSLLLTISVKN